MARMVVLIATGGWILSQSQCYLKLYLTQLMGVAFGTLASQLGFDKHIVTPDILKKF